MSREEAHRRSAASPGRGSAAGARNRADLARPQPPVFTARTDEDAGVIRTRGRLDAVGAEVLCRIVDALRTLGHRQIAVRFGDSTTADDDAHALLVNHAQELRTEGVRLLVV